MTLDQKLQAICGQAFNRVTFYQSAKERCCARINDTTGPEADTYEDALDAALVAHIAWLKAKQVLAEEDCARMSRAIERLEQVQ